jgi:ribosomal protein L37AE/L43A
MGDNFYWKNDILEFYQIEQKEIIRGVQCPKCDRIPMKYQQGLWHCSNCECKSKTAHQQAILDYFLLIQRTISNLQCRKFLLINSRKGARRILKSMDLQSSGGGRSLVYMRPQ